MGILDQILKALNLDEGVKPLHPAYQWLSNLHKEQDAPDPIQIETVDVVNNLGKLAEAYNEKHGRKPGLKDHEPLNWKVSIVDLLVLLDIDDRDRKARDELAKELGCPAELKSGSAIKNTWLHKRVLKIIAEKGGNIPQELFADLIKEGASSSIFISKFNQTTEIKINGNSGFEFNYITWAPVPCEIRLADQEGITKPIHVALKNQNPKSKSGQVVFLATETGAGQNELKLTLPKDGSPIPFFIAGKFGSPSIDNRDSVIEIVETSTGNVLSRTPLMVRIRKNANKLTDGERDRFLAALALLSLANLVEGLGGFADFADIHTNAGSREAHGNAGFLPWHRAFMLDLERELQAIDPSVTLPYWRFDEPAPNLFTKEFIGVPNDNDTLDFSDANPLRFMSPPIMRKPNFNTGLDPANVMNEIETIALGNNYASFRFMEGNPHGWAHGNFSGVIGGIGTAAKDPLFFMLHNNVDRLWAKWQWIHKRFDSANIDTYNYPGGYGDPGSTRIGHNLKDTMWPWNQITGTGMWDDRPSTAPGGNLPESKILKFPGPTPKVGDMIDYQGRVDRARCLGFDYDDVPFEGE